MSEADEFRRYAEESARAAAQATSEAEKKALIDLARTWTQAAVQIETRSVAPEGNAPQNNPS
jgi:hypothetical protein